MRPCRILVCGGRHCTDKEKVYSVLNKAEPFFADNFVIIEGGAKGVDILAKLWAVTNGHPCIEMEANWDYYQRAAGPIRNTWMLKWGVPDLVIGIDGGSGTKDMLRQAKKAGVTTYAC